MAANLPVETGLIYLMELYLSDWKPDQQAAGPITSVEKPVRIQLKGAPVSAQDVYYKAGSPYGYFQFSLPGNQFSCFTSAGLISLQSESRYEGHGVIQFRAVDGYPYDCTAIVNNVHIASQSGNRWKFSMQMQKPNNRLDGDQISPLSG